MDIVAVVGIGIGLAMDAFAVSVTNGAVTKKLRTSFAFKIAVVFAVFQMIMPIIGWLVGTVGESIISAVDHWIAFVLLLFIGGKMIMDFFKDRKKNDGCVVQKEEISNKTLIMLAVATSIDALTAGIIFPSAIGANTWLLIIEAVLIIGVITFILSLSGVYIGKAFGCLAASRAELLGGIVLICIGTKILFEHLVF